MGVSQGTQVDPLTSGMPTSPLPPQRAVQQAVGSSLQGDLANDKGMVGSGSRDPSTTCFMLVLLFSSFRGVGTCMLVLRA